MKLLGYLCALLLIPIFRGVALELLWGWFISPVLGVAAIGTIQAMGIALITSLLTPNYTEVKDIEGFNKHLIIALTTPIAAICAGYIYTLFM